MSGLFLVAWSWVVATVGAGIDRLRPRARELTHEEKLAPAEQAVAALETTTRERLASAQIQRRAAGSVGAQLEDHGPPATRQEIHQSFRVAQPEELGPGAARLIGGPRIDTASWVIRAGPLGFRCWRELVGAAQRGRGSVEWPDPWGEVVTLALERGAPGSGTFTLYTGRVRIEIRRSWAEIQLTSEAAEVEGVESWYLREMPRVMLWLRDNYVAAFDRGQLAFSLAGLGVEQRRIELCLDVAGWQLRAGDERTMVSRATVHPHWRDNEGLDGFEAGHRNKTPNSCGVYNKIEKLKSQRGPDRESLFERWREHGWQDGEPVTRIEIRLWGEALRLVGKGGQQLDATRPGAALDAELLGKLWADGLTRHRMVDLSAQRSRARDCPDLDVWARARAAGGQVEAVKLRRDVASRQLDAVRRHALARLGRVGAEVETLLEGDGTGAALLDALDKLLSDPGWDQDIARARARFADLLEQGKGAEP